MLTRPPLLVFSRCYCEHNLLYCWVFACLSSDCSSDCLSQCRSAPTEPCAGSVGSRGLYHVPKRYAQNIERIRSNSSRRPSLLMQFSASHQAPSDVGPLQRRAFGR